MEIRLQKWGNSAGVRIPSVFLKSLNLKTNDKVTIEQIDDKIIISKSQKEKVSLRDLFDKYEGENLAKDFDYEARNLKFVEKSSSNDLLSVMILSNACIEE